MRSKSTDRIENLRTRYAQLGAEITRLEARTKVDERKADTRRKILVGAVILRQMESQPEQFGRLVRELLSEKLTRPRDRALFGLDP